MYAGETVSRGSVIRLTIPYLNAARGNYTVVHVYSKAWLGIQSHEDGEGYNVPARLCRVIGQQPSNDRQLSKQRLPGSA